jgi:mannose-6-phosphate isomerase
MAVKPAFLLHARSFDNNVTPLVLPPNQFPRFYRGGPRIAAFRGVTSAGDRLPEDWIGSTTRAKGEDNGPSRLADGSALAAALAADPARFFEPAHLARNGPEPGVLVKLLDAGERLPVHYHPDRAFAERHLGVPHGKTEAWIILEAEPDAAVWLGFERDFDPAWVETKDIEAMLGAMRREPVAAGDVLYVPAGVPHAIGEGILLLELQEPSDLSILLEWQGIVAEEDAFLGLDLAVALDALRPAPPDQARAPGTLLSAAADAFFRADEGAEFEAGFAIIVVHTGEGTLECDAADPIPVRRGATLLVPYAAGAWRLTGTARAYRCRGPA